MKKKTTTCLLLSLLLLAGCGETNVSKDAFQTKQINIHRDQSGPEKTIAIRFYDKTPHVPYISVRDFYKEFFHTELSLTKEGNSYRYSKGKSGYLQFNSQDDTLSLYGFDAFGEHPDFKTDNAKIFLTLEKTSETSKRANTIALSDYKIDIRGDENAYVPLALLSSLSGGTDGYNIAYNGKDIFVLDARGSLSGEERNYSYFGNSYLSPIVDFDTPRETDLAEYAYYQLCFNFDHLRGYTTQLIFGDNNLLSLGLNGLLERYHPQTKNYLLSTNKREYCAGFSLLLSGLFDGGHTASEIDENYAIQSAIKEVPLDEDSQKITDALDSKIMNMMTVEAGYSGSKQEAFLDIYSPRQGKANYYQFDAATKTAYVGFDSFFVDYAQWDKYYAQGRKKEDLPGDKDSFAFVRSRLYQALNDGAKNVVLDFSTNGGGDSGALCGIYALFNGAKANFEMNNLVSHNRVSQYFTLDANLDGVFNDADVQEVNKFKTMKFACLTSPLSFSCGNLLPSMLKEIGLPIVGQRSGGGSCAITYESTADGLTYYRSSHLCLSNNEGQNIDVGVPLDFEIEVTENTYGETGGITTISAPKFYDFKTIADYLNSLE